MPTKVSGPVDPDDNEKMNSEEEIPVEEEALEAQVNDEDEDEDEEKPLLPEDLPPDTPIWVDGPTAGQIVEWKKQYGSVYVTSVTYEKHVAWRPLNRTEYRNIVKHIENLISSGKMTQVEANMENEEVICEVCCLYPKFTKQDFSREMAGLPSILSQQILESSGFTAWDTRGM
jgi:hypothetical protein